MILSQVAISPTDLPSPPPLLQATREWHDGRVAEQGDSDVRSLNTFSIAHLPCLGYLSVLANNTRRFFSSLFFLFFFFPSTLIYIRSELRDAVSREGFFFFCSPFFLFYTVDYFVLTIFHSSRRPTRIAVVEFDYEYTRTRKPYVDTRTKTYIKRVLCAFAYITSRIE